MLCCCVACAPLGVLRTISIADISMLTDAFNALL
jgi:hypothetical protein